MKLLSRLGGGEGRVATAVLAALLLASCSATTDNSLELNSPSFAPSAAGADQALAAGDGMASSTGSVAAADAGADGVLPDQVAYLPAGKPARPEAESTAAQAADAEAESKPAAAAAAESSPSADTVAAAEPAPAPVQSARAAGTPVEVKPTAFLTATDPETAPARPQQKRGFLASLFGSETAKPKAGQAAQQKAKPVVMMASAEAAPTKSARALVDLGDRDAGASALPGVRQSALFEIKRRNGLDDDSDVDVHEEFDNDTPIQVAYAAGLARLAPNGLLKQTDNVDVTCLKPSLVRVLKAAEQRYGKRVVVTSGYRSPQRNRAARGAKNSLHMYCAAADIQIVGVSKWELAKFFRAMPGRGGVGTYCHTESVHVDVGPERDWNWRCRRRG